MAALTARVLALVLCVFLPAHAQRFVPPPKQEVRAVWVATTAGLDWPKSFDKLEQQSSLKKIVTNLKAAHFNTILFQVRARGDAYYRSSYEPWAENLTGTLGKDPGWDPLAFLLTEAHRAGLEVHAWFNVYKIRGPSTVDASIPLHPSRRFAAWITTVDGEGWVDPGVPEVREYTVRAAVDLIRRYDLDGINFDYIRYPGKNFPDSETYRRYGRGIDRDDWRRSNIDRFVSAFFDSAMRIKPMLKVGSAPLGIFSGGSDSHATGAFYSFYQDSRGWLRKRIQDYLAPQLYWNLGASNDDPDFAELLRSWKQNSSGRQVWAGIAAYKPEVIRELPRQIDTSRSIHADGQAFFRYDHVSNARVLGNRYATLANIPSMPWKDSVPPLAPTDLAVTETAPNIFHLEWLAPLPARDGDRARYYNIYRSTSDQIRSDNASLLVAITNTDATFVIDTVRSSVGYRYYYAVSALDKGNNESLLSNTATVTLKELAELRGKLSDFASLSASIAGESGSITLLAYKLTSRVQVSLTVARSDSSGSPLVLSNGVSDAGTYVVGIPHLRPGSYVARLHAGETIIEQPLQLQR